VDVTWFFLPSIVWEKKKALLSALHAPIILNLDAAKLLSVEIT
jgi:hypothetical protein